MVRVVFLSRVFECTTACCEAGVEDVVMTTVTNDLQVTTAKFNIDTISYQGVLLSTVIVEPSHVVTLILPCRMVGRL